MLTYIRTYSLTHSLTLTHLVDSHPLRTPVGKHNGSHDNRSPIGRFQLLRTDCTCKDSEKQRGESGESMQLSVLHQGDPIDYACNQGLVVYSSMFILIRYLEGNIEQNKKTRGAFQETTDKPPSPTKKTNKPKNKKQKNKTKGTSQPQSASLMNTQC